jgi:hypothetical protein
MLLNSDILEAHQFTILNGFEASKREHIPANELSLIRKIAPKFREQFLSGGTINRVKQYLCSIAPYPTQYGFHNAYQGLNPFLYFNNRATLIQWEVNGHLKNFLFNPYFPDLSVHSGFYSHLKETIGKFIPESLLIKKVDSILDQLKRDGIRPEDIDYVSYDHLHVQDLRPLMGTLNQNNEIDQVSLFPNAYFIFHKEEWESVMNIHPLNEIWYVKDGFNRLNTEKLMLYEQDLQICAGAAIIHTPGHTAGNHSLYLNTDKGAFTISENGVGPDAYNPEKSKIKALRDTAKWKGWEVILNANTQDLAYLQYNSMIKEKMLSGESPQYQGFCNHHASSEFTQWRSAPGLSPTLELGAVEVGTLARK